MMQEPQVLIDARERANVANDASQAAYDELRHPGSTTMDNEKWYEIWKQARAAQDYFDALITYFYRNGPYPVPVR